MQQAEDSVVTENSGLQAIVRRVLEENPDLKDAVEAKYGRETEMLARIFGAEAGPSEPPVEPTADEIARIREIVRLTKRKALEVPPDSDGIWRVIVESGTRYVLNLCERSVARFDRGEVLPALLARWISGEEIRPIPKYGALPLVGIESPVRIAEPMRLIVGGDVDDHVETTWVTDIRRLWGPGETQPRSTRPRRRR